MKEEIRSINVTWLSATDLTNLNSGEGGSNYVDIKKFRIGGNEYPYVSGQAVRSYLKESIRRSLAGQEFMCIPDNKGETCGQIERCILCDLFGFMIPKKKEKGNEKSKSSDDDYSESEGGALTRTSPVKVAPAIGLLPFADNSTLDFLTRRKPQEKAEERKGDIVNVELGANLYKCGIDIDLLRVGSQESLDIKARTIKLNNLITPVEIRNRTKKVIEAVKYLADYSKQSRLLTDFTPDIVCISFQRKYSHRLQKLFELEAGSGHASLNETRLAQILEDVKGYSTDIHFGILSGIVKNEEAVIDTIKRLDITPMKPSDVFREALNHPYFKNV